MGAVVRAQSVGRKTHTTSEPVVCVTETRYTTKGATISTEWLTSLTTRGRRPVFEIIATGTCGARGKDQGPEH